MDDLDIDNELELQESIEMEMQMQREAEDFDGNEYPDDTYDDSTTPSKNIIDVPVASSSVSVNELIPISKIIPQDKSISTSLHIPPKR